MILEKMDRISGSYVYRLMTRTSTSLLAATLILGVAACGGKDKKGPQSPVEGVSNNNQGVDPANMDPTGDDTFGNSSDDPFEDDDGLRPPGVDLSPEKKNQIVSTNLQTGDAALTRNDPEQAITNAREALEADETSVEAMVMLARANYMKGYLDLAEDILNKALKRGGESNKQVHFLLGVIYEKTDREDEAPARYQSALALDPNYKSALINLGVTHLTNRRYAEAVSVYERLTGSLGVTHAAVWTNLGSAYRGYSVEFTSSDFNRRNALILKAEQSYRRAIKEKKNYTNVYYNLGLLYLDADPFPKGADQLDGLERLKTARGYFGDYRKMSGSDQKLADRIVAVTQKLIDKEEFLRKKAAEREAKAASRAAKEAAGGDDDLDSDEGFE